MRKSRYLYYFSLSHYGIYRNWVDSARAEGLNIEMISFVSILEYFDKRERIRNYNEEEYVHVYPSLPWKFVHLIPLLYFLIIILRTNDIAVHVRNRNMWPLRALQRIFGSDRVSYSFKIEGDHVAEQQYLRDNPYKKGFYQEYHENIKKTIESRLPKNLAASSSVLVVSEELKNALGERYGEKIASKANIVPTGVDTKKMYPSTKIRRRYREELQLDEETFVMVYLGSAFYSWQNVYRTLEIYDYLDSVVDQEIYLILLVPSSDHDIVESFIEELNIENGYRLTEVQYSEVNGYLNAADIGVVLREDHPMNVRCGRPTKLGEYLSAGLPVLTTSVLKDTGVIQDNSWGIVLDDMDNNAELSEKFKNFVNSDATNEDAIHQFAKDNFSTSAHADKFVAAIKSLRSR